MTGLRVIRAIVVIRVIVVAVDDVIAAGAVSVYR